MLCAATLTTTRAINGTFQSSSSPQAGCYVLAMLLDHRVITFQSSSSPQAGCYVVNPWWPQREGVSILIQPAGWMLCFLHCKQRKASWVSILIQPAGWMLWKTAWLRRTWTSFNPHPARRLDAISYSCVIGNSYNVSILIQPAGWMLWKEMQDYLKAKKFQSSSSPQAGCYFLALVLLTILSGFNPHPARRLDAILSLYTTQIYTLMY